MMSADKSMRGSCCCGLQLDAGDARAAFEEAVARLKKLEAERGKDRDRDRSRDRERDKSKERERERERDRSRERDRCGARFVTA
jgi:hypothetical protein